MDLRREAVRLRDELQEALQVPAKIRWGGFGELTVIVDGRAVFSKRRAGRVPQPGEVARLVRSRSVFKNAIDERRDQALRSLNGPETRGGTPPRRAAGGAPGAGEDPLGRLRRADRDRGWPCRFLQASSRSRAAARRSRSARPVSIGV